MKIANNFDPEKHFREQKLREKRTFWPRFFAKVGLALGWSAWFFVSFFGAQFLLAFLIKLASLAFHFNAKLLANSDFANAVIEILLYVLLILFFVVLPLIFLPKIRAKLSRKSVKVRTIERAEMKENFWKSFADSVGLSRKPRWRDLGQTIYFFPIFYFLLIAANLLATFVFGATAMNQQQNLSFSTSGNSQFQLVIIFISLCIVAPVSEELLLRGWMFTKLRFRENFAKNSAGKTITFREKNLGFWPTALVVSLVFALAHGQLNVGIMTFILSMCNSRIRENSGTIYGAILLHASVNFIAFAIKYLGFLHGAGIGV